MHVDRKETKCSWEIGACPRIRSRFELPQRPWLCVCYEAEGCGGWWGCGPRGLEPMWGCGWGREGPKGVWGKGRRKRRGRGMQRWGRRLCEGEDEGRRIWGKKKAWFEEVEEAPGVREWRLKGVWCEWRWEVVESVKVKWKKGMIGFGLCLASKHLLLTVMLFLSLSLFDLVTKQTTHLSMLNFLLFFSLLSYVFWTSLFILPTPTLQLTQSHIKLFINGTRVPIFR